MVRIWGGRGGTRGGRDTRKRALPRRRTKEARRRESGLPPPRWSGEPGEEAGPEVVGELVLVVRSTASSTERRRSGPRLSLLALGASGLPSRRGRVQIWTRDIERVSGRSGSVGRARRLLGADPASTPDAPTWILDSIDGTHSCSSAVQDDRGGGAREERWPPGAHKQNVLICDN
ncbi:hypothetical protein EJB05_45984, partial [Eragrostis curvula]